MKNIKKIIKDTIEFILRRIKTKLGIKEEIVLMDKMTSQITIYDKISGDYSFHAGAVCTINLRHLKTSSVIELLLEHHVILGRL